MTLRLIINRRAFEDGDLTKHADCSTNGTLIDTFSDLFTIALIYTPIAIIVQTITIEFLVDDGFNCALTLDGQRSIIARPHPRRTNAVICPADDATIFVDSLVAIIVNAIAPIDCTRTDKRVIVIAIPANDCDGRTDENVEVCDGVDNDLDNSVDEDAGQRYYLDGDGDGFGSSADVILACGQPAGHAVNIEGISNFLRWFYLACTCAVGAILTCLYAAEARAFIDPTCFVGDFLIGATIAFIV